MPAAKKLRVGPAEGVRPATTLKLAELLPESELFRQLVALEARVDATLERRKVRFPARPAARPAPR